MAKTKKSTGKKARQALDTQARDNIVRVAREMSASGLSPGRSGNVSCRFADGMLITPTALAYDTMTPDDIVFVAGDGMFSAEGLPPSSEWRFHARVYQERSDCHAVVHTHSENATALACANLKIPAFHYMVALAGGNDIPCVPYATYGTDALADHVASGLIARDACLMANHGQIAIGNNVDAALELARDVEQLATLYLKVRMLGRETLLNDDEMTLMVEKFKNYGRAAVTSKRRW